jgi:carbon storage regulator CsrA
MLVLSRKPGDRILINNDIEITVTRIRRGSVQIGIAAPQHVDIRRAELPQWGEAIVDVEQDTDRSPTPK